MSLLLAAAGARAATTVTCSVAAGSIAFGLYAANTSTGTLRITRNGSGSGSKSDAAALGLSTGLSGSYAVRHLVAGVNTLNYHIYWRTACSQAMGHGSGGPSPARPARSRCTRAAAISPPVPGTA